MFGPDVNAIGERVAINGAPFLVKGLLGPYPELADGGALDGTAKEQLLGTLESVAYTPFGTPAAIVFGDGEPVSFVVEVKDVGRIEETVADVRDVLIRLARLQSTGAVQEQVKVLAVCNLCVRAS